MLLYLADFALQEQAEDNLTVAFLFGEHNGEFFILLPYLKRHFYQSSFWILRLHCISRTNWNNREVVEVTRSYFFN